MPRSGTRKNQNKDGADLLERLGQPIEGEDIFPVFVSEADAPQKTRAIEDSAYLSFAYEELDAFKTPLVVFGSYLGPRDQHLVDAIAKHPSRPIAVSIRPGDEVRVKKDKAHYAEVLSSVKELLFFDSTTHPLRDPQAFVWSSPMGSEEIAAQLAPIKTVLLPL